MYHCKYCENTFTEKTNVTRHEKNSVRCINARVQISPVKSKYTCVCGYFISRKDMFTRHQSGCRFVMSATIEVQTQTIKSRDKTIKDRDTTIISYKKTVTELEEQVKLLMSRHIVDAHVSDEAIVDNKEKSEEAIQEAFRDKIAIDLRPYDKKDVLYFGIFEASNVIELEKELPEDVMLCKFGVSSNITMRNGSHESGKQFPKFRIVHVVKAGSRNDVSVAEKHVKRVVTQMDLRINYGNSKECFMATEEQLRQVVIRADKFAQEDVENVLNIGLEMRRLDLKATKKTDKKIDLESRLVDLFSEGKITYEQMKEMLDK
jgi:5-carboxymethyl-2-hydroxymuconate isomerase